MAETRLEPWLRGTWSELDPVRRAAVHAFQLAGEDVERWCAPLTDEQMNARPGHVAPVAFHLRHMARSLDRLLTYAEGRQLREAQLAALAAELSPGAHTAETLAECYQGLEQARARMLALDPASFAQGRTVGRNRLPTTVGGLLVHCAEHTQRHAGQAITTAQIVSGSKLSQAIS